MVQVLFDANNVVVVARRRQLAGEIRRRPLLDNDAMYWILNRDDSAIILLPIAIVNANSSAVHAAASSTLPATRACSKSNNTPRKRQHSQYCSHRQQPSKVSIDSSDPYFPLLRATY